jgi:hypothetical protein
MLSCGHTNGWGRQAKLVAGGLPSRQLTQDRSRGILSAVSRPGVEDMGRHEGCRPQYWLFVLFSPTSFLEHLFLTPTSICSNCPFVVKLQVCIEAFCVNAYEQRPLLEECSQLSLNL